MFGRSSSSSNRPPTRQGSLGKTSTAAGNSSVSEVMSGRRTPQSASSIGARPDSASGISRRHVASPETVIIPEKSTSMSPATLFDELGEDDEIYKGHGVTRRQSSGPSGRWTPTILSGIIRRTSTPAHSAKDSASKQMSPKLKRLQHAEPEEMTENDLQQHSGRKTPAKYRPAASSEDSSVSKIGVYDLSPSSDRSPSQQLRNSQYRSQPHSHHPLSHAHKISDSTGSNSSLSIQMHSPQLQSHSRRTSLTASHSRHTSMQIYPPKVQVSPNPGSSSVTTANSSPLVVPQARRGAINLRPAGRRKRAAIARRRMAAAAAAKASALTLPQQLHRLLSITIKALRSPLESARCFKRYVFNTLHGIDNSFRDPRTGQRIWNPSWLGAYIPLLIWLVVSLSSTFTVLIWHTQVFQALDRLSKHLQEMGIAGRLLLGSLIFLTTFPPLPLYSTLIILCGFSFGLLQGFIISYVAALSGAIVVFLLSRSLLKGWMVELLNKSGGLKKVVRAIEKRPKLLFLVRLAPYPYNLMNTLLASSPTLTLQTYTLCTALALPKLLVHCALGTSIKNFAAYNGAGADQRSPLFDDKGNMESNGTMAPPMIGYDPSTDASSSETAEMVKHIFGFIGLGLCVGIFLYLLSVARKAVDEELDEDGEIDEYDILLTDEEEDEEHGEEGSDLDYDELNISRHSNESSKEGRQRTPLSGSTSLNIISRKTSDGGASDSTLLNSRNGVCSQAGEAFIISNLNRRGGPGNDIFTPNFTASRQYNDSCNPYFTQHGINSNSSNNRHISDSQVSLADSIVEMEKHAVEMEQTPLFQHAFSDKTSTPYLDDDSSFHSESSTLQRE